jgi:hypothetical protein
MMCDIERGKHVKRCCKFRRKNMIKREAKKIIKYKEFTTEIQQMWKVTTKIITNNRGH